MVRCTYECTLWSTFFFIQFINGLTERYPEIFDGGGSSSPIQENFGKKWGSYITIVELADNDITRFDLISQEPLEKCLLYLCYKADKSVVEQTLHKESLAKVGKG
jgi:hypothetical protein